LQSYARAGVDISAATRTKEVIKELAQATLRPEVLAGPGLFGGLFELRGYHRPVLVSSCDGVGTKLILAVALGRYEGIGMDIVNHSVNDILTAGADPLFFLDYIAMGKLSPEVVTTVVKGMSMACQEVGCALIGGETAEMPGLYAGQDFDVVGFIVGAVEKENVINGQNIACGDALIGLPSSGLHTNGYSLARKVLGESQSELSRFYPELGGTLGDALLEPHRCYYKELKPLLSVVKGLAHITGGGLLDNVPRILPPNLAAHFCRGTWAVPAIFSLIQRQGKIGSAEAYHVFNMGIGMVVICSPKNVDRVVRALPGATIVGDIIQQSGPERVIID